jgi:integrase
MSFEIVENKTAKLYDQAGKVFDLLDVRETTRADYKGRIGYFIEYIKEHGLNCNSFLEFKRSLADKTDWSVSTKNKYLCAAGVLLRELNRIGELQADITLNIKRFNQSKKHTKEGLNEEEIQLLTAKIRDLPKTPQNTRLKAILALLTLQGLRQIEVVRLDVKDIDFVAKTAAIHGKGRDDKEPIDLQPGTVEALQEYLKTNKIADGALFTSRSNNSLNKRLTTRSLRGLVKVALNELSIDRNKSTHGFRHYFVTKLISRYKGDLLEVARYSRHRSLETLQVYNDNIKRKADLPRFYETFNDVKFCG